MYHFLMLKIHNKTGLKYLCKTSSLKMQKSIDYLYKYPGSGLRWLNHLKQHGFDFKTIVLAGTPDKQELKELGLRFSKLWNVVESDNFANLVEEKGDGGKIGLGTLGKRFHHIRLSKVKGIKRKPRTNKQTETARKNIQKAIQARAYKHWKIKQDVW